MSNIVEFVKAKNKNDDGDWLFDLSVYGHDDGETSCFITATGREYEGMNRGSATREMATRLDDLSFLMRQFAEKYDATEEGEAIIVLTLFAGGLVRIRTNVEKVATQEQRQWVRDQLDAAKTDKNIGG